MTKTADKLLLLSIFCGVLFTYSKSTFSAFVFGAVIAIYSLTAWTAVLMECFDDVFDKISNRKEEKNDIMCPDCEIDMDPVTANELRCPQCGKVEDR